MVIFHSYVSLPEGTMRMLFYIDDVKVESCAALYGFWFHLQIGKPEKDLDRIIAATPPAFGF